MAVITIYTPSAQLRIIRPLPSETDQDFRRRMEAMILVLAERDPTLVAVIVDGPPGCSSCVITQRPSGEEGRQDGA